MEFNEFAFLLGAVSNDTTRDFFCYPYYDHEHNCVVSCDGWRLHMKTYPENEHPYNESTYVKILKDKKTYTMLPFPEWKGKYQFPNYMKVIPDGDFETFDLTLYKRDFDIEIPRFLYNIKRIINLSHLEPLKGSDWTVQVYGERDAIRFIQGSRGIEAVIMPMLKD